MRAGTRCLASCHNMVPNDLPRRLTTHATTTFKYFIWKVLNACVQRSAMVHMLVPKHSREEEVDLPLIEN